MKACIKYLVSAVMLFSFNTLHAQSISMGAEGEITSASVKVADINQSLLNSINGKSMAGYEIGPYFKINAGPIYIKPKFLISYQSGIVEANYADESSANVTLSLLRLDVPVLVGLKVLGPLSIEAGPVYNRLIYATKDFNGNNIDIEPNGVGYRIGANLQLGPIGLNAGYQGVKNGSSSDLSSFSSPNELIFGASIGF
jgi:hypothetical protein